MADSKISALPDAGALQSGDQFVIARSGADNSVLANKHMSGFELDYVEITGVVTITATADGNGGGTAVIDGNSVSYDGSTRIKIEVYAPYWTYGQNNQNVLLNLYDGTTDLGRLANLQSDGSTANLSPVQVTRFFTPSNASHTYHIRGWKTSSSGTAQVGAGAGGASTYMPAYMRITVA